MSIDSSIHQLYLGYFGRPADKYGFNHWDAVAAESGIGHVRAAFASAAEFMAVMSISSLHVVDTVFQNCSVACRTRPPGNYGWSA